MKNHIGIIGLGLLFVLQSCSPGAQIQNNSNKTMLIKSTGSLSIQPDQASISISLECVDKNITSSKNCLISKSENLNKLILSHGIAQEDILTTAINQSKEYTWQQNSRVFVGYKSSMSTSLTIKNLKNLELLYTNLLLAENISVGSLYYTHSEMDSLNNVAYQNALASANTTADQLLAKMIESKKEILRVGNIDLPAVQNNNNYKMEMAEMSRSDNSSTIKINNGNIKVQKMLVVEYLIE